MAWEHTNFASNLPRMPLPVQTPLYQPPALWLLLCGEIEKAITEAQWTQLHLTMCPLADSSSPTLSVLKSSNGSICPVTCHPRTIPGFPLPRTISQSSSCKALPKLPSVSETTDLVTQHVFHLCSILLDTISNQGPQFISQVWKSFCQPWETSAWLSSDFHPHINGQMEWNIQDLEAALCCNPMEHTPGLVWVCP